MHDKQLQWMCFDIHLNKLLKYCFYSSFKTQLNKANKLFNLIYLTLKYNDNMIIFIYLFLDRLTLIYLKQNNMYVFDNWKLYSFNILFTEQHKKRLGYMVHRV